MELNEKLDKSYNKDKKAYEKITKLETIIKKLEKDLKTQTRTKEDAQIKKIRAHEDKDKVEEKKADDEIKAINENIKDTKDQIKELQGKISKNKEKVDSYINELNKDPEFQAHMNSILEKKYNRARNRAIKEKEQIDLIIDVCEKHPSLEMNLKGMIRAREELQKVKDEINKLKEEADRLDPVNEKLRLHEIYNTELPALDVEKDKFLNKTSVNEKAFRAFCAKNDIAIDDEFLATLLMEDSFSHNKGTGEIQALKTFKNMSKGYDRKIRNYEKCIQKIPGARMDKLVQEKTDSDKEKGTQGQTQQRGTTQGKGGKSSSSASIEENTEESNLPDKKYKWYEFGKRFSAWKEKRRVQKAIKNGELPQEETEEEKKKAKSSNKFRDAYKYDVVKDYIDNQMKEMYKEANKETRQEGKKEQSEEKEER